jgi:hypothetical protein
MFVKVHSSSTGSLRKPLGMPPPWRSARRIAPQQMPTVELAKVIIRIGAFLGHHRPAGREGHAQRQIPFNVDQ